MTNEDEDERIPRCEMEQSIYANNTASEVFVEGLAGIINQEDVASIVLSQKKMLQRFEKTNEMLANCNSLSSSRLEKSSQDFKNHTLLLSEMKKDLDFIFKKIKSIKTKIAKQNPELTNELNLSSVVKEEEDDEYDQIIKRKKSVTKPSTSNNKDSYIDY